MLKDRLVRAFKNNEFTLYIQPKVDIYSSEIVGGEALSRWQHPEKGILTPIHFISKIEKMGLVEQLDLYIFEEVCRCLAKWKNEGMTVVPISVNISQMTLGADSIVEKIKFLLEKYEIDPQLLEIEITESLMCTNTEVILQLKQGGIKVAMDDFGTGYSSLAVLKQLPLDIVKIDRAFLADVEKSKTSQAIFETIVDLLKILKKEIIVEGVENLYQLQFIKERGCRFAQGFLFEKPLSIQNYEKKILEEINKRRLR
ncbi:MAG: EAL domain-containing protein [Cellulosilyticaceae bacterium]